ncbi:MAG: hypothetical protein K8R37_06875 [Bacteroidales bacterium]|nr:hypothetical protein [Bacteroidales bacterium]
MKNKSAFWGVFVLCLLFISILKTSAQDNNVPQDTTENDSLQNEIFYQHSLKFSDLKNRPFRTVKSASLTTPSAYYLKGNRMFYYGIEADGDYIFIDGMQVRDGNEFPFRSIGSYRFYGINSPIYMGNSAGGFIDIQSSEVEDKFSFNIEFYKDLVNFLKEDHVEFNVGVPVRFGKKGSDKKSLTIYLAGSYNKTNNTDPIWENCYHVNPDTLTYLANNPLRPTGLPSGGTFMNAEFVRYDDIITCKTPKNAGKNSWNSFAKIKIPVTENIELTLGNYTKIQNTDRFIFDNALFNYDNNPERYVRNFDNYLKFEHKINISDEFSIGYNVHLQYSNYYARTQSKKHEDRFFEYGYLGKYQTYKTPTYELGDVDINGQPYENVWLLNSWDYDTAYTFQNLNYNPEAARFTEQAYEFYSPGSIHNLDELWLAGGLTNGQNPPGVYGLWNSPGDQSPYSTSVPGADLVASINYMENAEEKIRGMFRFEADYKSHHFTAGFEYMKEIKRFYSMNPMGLWSAMRGMTNYHIQQLDINNPVPVYNNNVFQDTVIFYRVYDAIVQSDFDKNLRKKLGLPIDGVDFILTDSYDMVNNTIDYYDKDGVMHTIQLNDELYSLDMFSPTELLYHRLVQYKGYDYTGNKLKNKPGPYDFFTDWSIDAFRPVYFSGYIQDQFTWKNLNVSVGLRIDRYDANQPVLKDKYSLMEIYSAGEINLIAGTPVNHPSNIGNDYAVYIDNINDPTHITGYRDGDTWYNRDGVEIMDPNDLNVGSGVSPYLIYPDIYLGEPGWTPDMSFTDYKPVVNFLPQVNIDYTLNRITNFYTNFNSYSQNPNFYNEFRPDMYWMFNNLSLFPNPDLKPLRTYKLNIGVKQKIFKQLFADAGFFVTGLYNYQYFGRIKGAYPHDYTTILNYDSTIFNKGFIGSLNYFSPKTSGLNLNISVTKFITGEFFFLHDISEYPNFTETSDLIINSFAGFNFGIGRDYIGPVSGNWKVLEDLGLSIFYQFRKGTPYFTLEKNEYQIEERQLKYTPNFNMFNLKLEKGFYMKNGSGINIYLLVENLFNFKNVFYVYPKTGKPDDDGYLSAPEWQQEINDQIDPQSYRTLYQLKLINPQHYDIPRIWRAGLILHF